MMGTGGRFWQAEAGRPKNVQTWTYLRFDREPPTSYTATNFGGPNFIRD